MSKCKHSWACPLCQEAAAIFLKETEREYWQCSCCRLVFMPPVFHLSPQQEKARYQEHRNHPQDQGYREFLSRLAKPMLSRLPQGAKGLDYGSGPGPTLSVLFKEAGYEVKNFDPYFAPDEKLLNQKYDFITCTETAEHFANPRKEWKRLAHLMKPGAYLGVMTEWMTQPNRFAQWYYRRDPTHVCFYTPGTLAWIAKWLNFKVEFVQKNVALFQSCP